MYLAHFPDENFYYLGTEPADSGTYDRYTTNADPKLVGMDVETISLKDTTPIGIGISITTRVSFYFPLHPTVSSYLPWKLIKDPSVVKVFHNAPFDLHTMEDFEMDNTNVMDTAIMARLLRYKSAVLSDLVHVHHMEAHEVKEVLKEYNAKTMLDLPEKTCAAKCMQDSSATLKLYLEFLPDIDYEYLQTEMKVIPILLKMSNKGLLIDQQAREIIEENLQDDVDYLLKLCQDQDIEKPGSPKQVAYILAERGAYTVFPKLPYTDRTKKNLSTDGKKILPKMTDPLAGIVLRWRKQSKLLSTYIKPWADDERAYTRFHMDAVTGRPTSTKRNMQNIPPGEMRGILLPDTGIWTDTDWSQLELRVLAYLSQDPEMLRIYSLPKFNKDGSLNEEADIHQQTAIFLGIARRLAKTINFAMVYGGTDSTLAETAGVSIQRAKQLRIMWFQKFAGAGSYINWVQALGLSQGYVTTVFGRNIRLPALGEDSPDGIQRKAVDYPCQGSAAEILKRGLILCDEAGMDMRLQIHDEILVDGFVHQDNFKMLENIAPFETPIEVKYLSRWE